MSTEIAKTSQQYERERETSVVFGYETWMVLRAIITILSCGMHFSSMGLPPT